MMRYLFALIFPPLGVLLCGKPFQAILCFFLTMFFYFPGALYALLVASNYYADRRIDRLGDRIVGVEEKSLKELRKRNREEIKLTKAMRKHVEAQTEQVKVESKIKMKALSPGHPSADFEVDEPAAPKLSVGERLAIAKESLLSIKSESIRAYQNMPEWAQPITWGLAAGSVLSLGLVIFLVAKRV